MEKDYSNVEKGKVLKEFKSSLSGLNEKEVKRRLKEYGLNELPKEKKKTKIQIFFSSLVDPIIFVLFAASILSFIVGETIDAIAILFIIIVDAIVSTIQEYRAEQNSEALKNLIKVKVKVIRENRHKEIDSENIVPGDIIVIEPGTVVSADARILTSNNLSVNESILTGESIGVNKSFEPVDNKDVSKKCMLYAGTSVLTGRALAVVVNTGINTEVGKIAQKVTGTEETPSPLTIRMEKFSKQTLLIKRLIFHECP